MAGHSINVAAALQCPHGGTVQIASANVRTSADGSFMVLATDASTIKGCPFQLPVTPPVPSPCLTVRWLVTDMRVAVNGARVVSRASGGLCESAAGVPQGPVSVAQTQAKATAQ